MTWSSSTGEKNTTAEIAAGVDASGDVREDSGLIGFEIPMMNSQPHLIGTGISGGGSVGFTGEGAEVTPGATSGDKAAMWSWRELDLRKDVEVLTIDLLYFVDGAYPLTDDAEMGWTSDGVNDGAGAHLDLTADQYQVAGSTAACGIDPSHTMLRLSIEIDQGAGETRFHHAALSSGNTESVTIPAEPYVIGKFIQMQSNGSGDAVKIMYARVHAEMKEGFSL